VAGEPRVSSTPRTVAMLVLNYDGVAHLDACVSSLERAAERYPGGCALVCVDNRSTDGSVDFVRHRFPRVEIVVSPCNDFLFSLNEVVAARTEDVVIIVNNDMRFDPAFVDPLMRHFEDADVFAVGAAILTWTGDADTIGPRCARLEHGWFHKWWSYDRQEPALTLEASGGAAAYRREMFVALGGFDALYRPGYYEDLDLSYRAWARGWKVVYEPHSRAYHKESVSMLARYGESGKARLLYRNHLLFTIKNIGGTAFLAEFAIRLPFRVLAPVLRGYRVPLSGFLEALPLVPAALARRFSRKGPSLDLNRFAHVTTIDSLHHV
jgi:GT2 family glycosyltransferase